MRNCGTAETTKEVKSEKIQGCVRPTAVYKIETPIKEPFEVKYVIQPALKTQASSGIRTMDVTKTVVKEPTKEINYDPMHASAQAGVSNIRNYVNTNEFNPERYTQHTNAHSVETTRTSSKNHTRNRRFDGSLSYSCKRSTQCI